MEEKNITEQKNVHDSSDAVHDFLWIFNVSQIEERKNLIIVQYLFGQ